MGLIIDAKLGMWFRKVLMVPNHCCSAFLLDGMGHSEIAVVFCIGLHFRCVIEIPKKVTLLWARTDFFLFSVTLAFVSRVRMILVRFMHSS